MSIEILKDKRVRYGIGIIVIIILHESPSDSLVRKKCRKLV